jgi:hypothetical protein
MALAFSAVAFGAAASAWGQCDVFLLGVPDFDQKREGLVPIDGDANNGASACVPTSGANWLAYIANHGYPAVFAGARDWQSQNNYHFVTTQIQVLMADMGTDGNGTPLTYQHGDEPRAGYDFVMQAWLNLFAPGKFIVQSAGTHSPHGPTPGLLDDTELVGGLVVLSFGKFNITQPDEPVHYASAGGHVISLTSVSDACSSTPLIGTHNPNTDENDLLMQSPFMTDWYPLQQVEGIFPCSQQDSDCVDGEADRVMWRRILQHPNPDAISVLDAYAVIWPIFGLSSGPHYPSSVEYHFSSGAGNFGLTAAPRPVGFHLPEPTDEVVVGFAQEPATPYSIVLSRSRDGSATLWRLNPAVPLEYNGVSSSRSGSAASGSYRISAVRHAWEKLGAYAQPGPMVFGGEGELYLFAGRTLMRLDPSTTPPTVQNTLTGIATPPAVAFDRVSNSLIILLYNRTQLGIARSDDRGSFSFSKMGLPPEVDLGQGDVSMFVSPTDGSFWLATDASDVIYRLGFDAAGQLQLRERVVQDSIVAPRNLQVTSRGTLVFTSKGILHELEHDARTGEWNPVQDVPFVGKRVGNLFVLSQPADVPGLGNSPDDVNIVPPPNDGQPRQAADLNGDGVTDSKDLLAFTAAYARDRIAHTTGADYNGDGITNAEDLRAFRTEFLAERNHGSR